MYIPPLWQTEQAMKEALMCVSVAAQLASLSGLQLCVCMTHIASATHGLIITAAGFWCLVDPDGAKSAATDQLEWFNCLYITEIYL